MSDPCTTQVLGGQTIGDPCVDCGHTNVVHPGRHNPVLDSCVICLLLTDRSA